MFKKFFYNKLVNDVLTTTMWSTFGKGIGFLIPFFVAAWFGVGTDTDIFFFVYTTIFYLASIFSDSLESNVVPFLAHIGKDKKNIVSNFLNKLLSLLFLATVGLGLILTIFGGYILSAVTRFPREYSSLMSQLILEFCPFLILVVISSVLAGLLNAHSRFWLPAISPGIRAGICIATIFVLKERFGIHSIAIGYIVGELARLAAFVFVLTRERIIFLKLDFDFDPSIISFFKVISFQIVCMITIGLNPVVDKAMASWLSTGSVSILQYADRINIIPIVFVSSGLIVVMLSRWSNLYYEYKNINVLRNDLRITLRAVLFISLAIVIVLFMFSKQLVSIAYARGKFPGLFIDPVRSAFLWYLIGTPFYLLGQVVVRAHLVLHNTKTLMITAFIANIFNIVLNLVLMYFFGVNGIAMSTSIVSIIMFLHLHRAFDQLVNKKLSTLGHAN